MIAGELNKALGAGMKVFAETVSVANGDTVDTGLSTIYSVSLTSSATTHIASVGGISGGTITVNLTNVDPSLSASAAVTTAEDVYVVAIGQ